MILKGKATFITGGTAGIGLACARRYASLGAQVAVCGLDRSEAEHAAGELGNGHLGFACDVSDPKSVCATVGQAVERLGRLDALHLNAGIAEPAKALHETTVEEWQRILAVNLSGVFHGVRAAFDYLRVAQGTILLTSSMVGELGQEKHAAYAATKGAMNALVKSMALDYAPLGIRVNAVAPAGVWTPMLRSWMSRQQDPAVIEKYLNEIHVLGYCPEPDTIADVCSFLLSDASRFITGCILPVGGGAELGYRRSLKIS